MSHSQHHSSCEFIYLRDNLFINYHFLLTFTVFYIMLLFRDVPNNLGTGKWHGWYEKKGKKTYMHFNSLHISPHGKIVGSGSDRVGRFTIKGNVYKRKQVDFVKRYVGKHSVHYKGKLVNGRITGRWNIGRYLSGKFMLIIGSG